MTTQKLSIVVIGASNIGGTIGSKWVAANHTVTFAVTDINGTNAQKVRHNLGDKAIISTVADALRTDPDVVLLALPGPAVAEVVQANAAALNGRIIIDATNNLGTPAVNGLASLQQYTPNAHIFRAFNTYGWPNYEDAHYAQGRASLFFCGPDTEARSKVEQLITDVGFDPVYIGGLEQVAIVDSVTQLYFALAMGQKRGLHLALQLLT